MKIAELLPSLYQEIEADLERLDREELLAQLPALKLERYTLNDDALYLYTRSGMSQVAENIDLSGIPGMLLIDLDEAGRVMGIEVLERKDVIAALQLLNITPMPK